MNPDKQPAFFYGWTIIAVGIITGLLIYGARYSFSIFFPEILDEFGWSRGSTALMMSINVLVYGFMAPISGTFCERWKPRTVMPVGAAVIALAMVGCSFASELWHFYLFFGILVPVGTALCGWPVIAPALINWFAVRRGLVLGLGQMGSGLGLVYGLVAEYLILWLGWRHAYLALAGILIVILFPLHRFIFQYRPENIGLRAYGSESPQSKKAGKGSAPPVDWTLRRMLHAPQLWLLALSQFLYWGIACFLVLAHQVKFAEDAGYSGTFAVSIFALYGISMFAGQMSGVLSDRIGREASSTVASALAIAGLAALISVRDTSTPWLLYAYATSFGYGAGLYAAIIFAGAADIFHGRCYGTASGMMLTGMGLGGAIGPWLGGYLYDRSGSYDLAFLLCMACLVLSSVFFWIAAPRHGEKFRARLSGSFTGEASPDRKSREF